QIMLGLAPAAARPEPTSALVIGFGSGVTTRVLADVPGMRRVRVVEIEPAVLSVSGLFAGVNDSVLARPAVSAVADDARSALQLRRDLFDVIVSEPSNPWVAGVATLYTPAFFPIVRSRLVDGGAQLAERGTLTHRDDRPELEFVAARRFLDADWDAHVFDSLMALELRVGGHPGTSPVLLARAMTAPRLPSTQGPILMAAHRAQPDNPVWLVRVARDRKSTRLNSSHT